MTTPYTSTRTLRFDARATPQVGRTLASSQKTKTNTMSTRSAIIRKTETGTYEGIYCHYDGYETGVGATLLEHYQDADKVKRLIALGSISQLAECGRVEPVGPHSFAKPEPGTVVAYMRDRGEKAEHCATIQGPTVKDVEENIGHNGYIYVYEDGEWTCNGVPLADAVAAAQREEKARA